MLGCRVWMRNKDDIAAFRCGDTSNKGIELCLKCKEKYRKEFIIMNGKKCDIKRGEKNSLL